MAPPSEKEDTHWHKTLHKEWLEGKKKKEEPQNTHSDSVLSPKLAGCLDEMTELPNLCKQFFMAYINSLISEMHWEAKNFICMNKN